jgi:hypothetical protein
MSARPWAGAVTVGRVLAVSLLALAASVADACELTQEHPAVRISGPLTLKSSEPGAWWAVTDDEGRIWKIASPPPELEAIFEKIQNQRISVEGCQLEKELNFEQIEPHLVTSAPEPVPSSAPEPVSAPEPAPASIPATTPVPAPAPAPAPTL